MFWALLHLIKFNITSIVSNILTLSSRVIVHLACHILHFSLFPADKAYQQAEKSLVTCCFSNYLKRDLMSVGHIDIFMLSFSLYISRYVLYLPSLTFVLRKLYRP